MVGCSYFCFAKDINNYNYFPFSAHVVLFRRKNVFFY